MEDAHSVAAAGGDTEVSTVIAFFSYAWYINIPADNRIIACL